MQSKEKHSSLKSVYYRSFSWLVVIPLLLVFAVAMVIVGYIVRDTAIDTIDTFQDNVAATLASDIRTASLQLSHFAFVNDGEFMALAARACSGDNTAGRELERAFRSAMVPSQDILSGKFLAKDGGKVYMKDDIKLTDEQLQGEHWYQEALLHKNQVVIGGYDTSKTDLTTNSQKGQQLVLATAMSPEIQVDRSESIEMITFLVISRAGDIIRKGNGSDNLGTTVLLDGRNSLIYGDMGNTLVQQYFDNLPQGELPQTYTKTVQLEPNRSRPYLFKVLAIPMTDWKVVTFTQTGQLTQGFYNVGGMMVLVILSLLTMFYFFSRYFLDAIVAPMQTVVEGMKQLVDNDLDIQLEPEGHAEIRTLMESFNQMVRSLKNMLMVNEEAHKRKHTAEIRALQSQINPHFIVNTLNSIRFMAQVAKFEGLQKMAEALMNIVSCSFRGNISFYTVQEELGVLDSYIYLMRIRYSDGFEVRYEVDDNCLAYRLPRLILQPVVENAITHGFVDQGDELGQIVVSVYRDKDYLYLAVKDNGQGMTAQQIEEVLHRRKRSEDDNTSIGLENVLSRLRLNFGEQAQMEIDSRIGEYTRTVLRLPLMALETAQPKEDREEQP